MRMHECSYRVVQEVIDRLKAQLRSYEQDIQIYRSTLPDSKHRWPLEDAITVTRDAVEHLTTALLKNIGKSCAPEAGDSGGEAP